MTGLHFIRFRSNFSLSELAEVMGVSRQAINSWESGKKPIPKIRLQALEDFYGIDKKYFGLMTDQMKQEIMEMPMYKYIFHDKVKFLFHAKPEEWDEAMHPVYFFSDQQESFDEKIARAEQLKRELLREIDQAITGPSSLRVYERENYTKNRCEDYRYLTDIVQHLQSLPTRLKGEYQIEYRYIMDAMMISFGIRSEKDIRQEYKKRREAEQTADLEFVLVLAAFLKEHWNHVLQRTNAEYNRQGVQSAEQTENSTDEKSVENRIAEAVRAYRQFKEEGGDAETFTVWV